MSQSQFADSQREEPRTVTDAGEMDSVLELLDDEDCRRVLSGTVDDALTVAEIGERFDIPQSTAYRKVEALADAGLLEEKLRVRSSGNHVSEYTCCVESVSLSIDGGSGITLSLAHTESESPFPSAGRLFGG
ncbi:MAG: helix-turn-helix domain-containing protein [Halobacteriaceae archaeon]